MPQIEVAFDIDANGILNVHAKDKATSKSQSIVIKANSGLTEAEIQKMVKDAEAHAEEDKKFNELIGARNQADHMVHAVEKSLKDLAAEVQPDEKTAIEAALGDLREAMKGNDKDAITQKTEKLAEASAKLAERAYKKAGGGAQQQPGDASGAAPGAESGGAKKDDVVDAEFSEVKDEKK
jgi:molecular chaperone DnaK